MQQPSRNFFAAPNFPGDEEKTRSARYLNASLWSALFLIGALGIRHLLVSPSFFDQTGVTLTALFALMGVLLAILRQGYVRSASSLLVIIAWCALTFQAWAVGGIHDSAYIADVVIILLAGLLLGYRASVIFTVLTILAGWVLGYLETAGLLVPFYDTPYSMSADFTVVFSLIALISYLTINSLRDAIDRANAEGRSLMESNQELQDLRVELEQIADQRAAELEGRGRDLEMANQRTARRVAQLRAISEVARAITSVQNLEDMLPRLATLIGEGFGFYHVGIYLIDEAREEATLSAAYGVAGQRMLGAGHTQRVGESGLVGLVARSGQSRVAMNAGPDAIFFSNPELPEARLEIALPLQIGDRIAGVLDLQSTSEEPIAPEDLEALTTLADQVSIAIENTRLFEETRRSLSDAENVYRQYLRQEWNNVVKDRTHLGFRYTAAGSEPMDETDKSAGILRSLSTGQIQMQTPDAGGASMAVPIKLRGEVVGVVDIRSSHARTWNEDEIDIAQAVAERVALAVENARLLKDSQRRATKERTIGEITSKISSSINMRNVLQTAVEELGRIMPGSEIVIQFQETNGRTAKDK